MSTHMVSAVASPSWCLAVSCGCEAVSFEDQGEEGTSALILVDSACEVHLADRRIVQKNGNSIGKPPVQLDIRAAGGHGLQHHGSTELQFACKDGRVLRGEFAVSDIGKTILSVAQLVDKGYTVEFGQYSSQVRSPCGDEMPLTRSGGMFHLPAHLLGSAPCVGAVVEALPVEGREGREGGPPDARAVLEYKGQFQKKSGRGII